MARVGQQGLEAMEDPDDRMQLDTSSEAFPGHCAQFLEDAGLCGGRIKAKVTRVSGSSLATQECPSDSEERIIHRAQSPPRMIFRWPRVAVMSPLMLALNRVYLSLRWVLQGYMGCPCTGDLRHRL